MKKTFFFTLTLVLTLELVSCGSKESNDKSSNEEKKPAAEEKTEETTSQGAVEFDESYAHSGVEFEYNGLHYEIINHNSVFLVYHESYQSIRGKLVIPSKVRYNDATYYVVGIACHAFEDNPYIASVVIPKTVKVIYEAVFAKCSNLSTVTLPEGLIHLDRDIFYGSNLHSITLPDGIDFIGPNAFDNTPFYNNEANWEDGVLYSGNYLVDAKEISHCSIKEGTKYIADRAFNDCFSLTSVTIPNTVTRIGDHAFYKCSSLTSISIPNSVTSIGEYAFAECTGLTSISIPNSVTSIGNSAFSGCSSLTSVSVPSRTEIDTPAFPEHTKIIRK